MRQTDLHEMLKVQSSKVIAMYDAVNTLIAEGTDINGLKVSDITRRAGIGKGTAYEYFETKEELIGKAVFYQMHKSLQGLTQKVQSQPLFKGMIYAMFEYLEENHERYRVLVRYLCYYVQGIMEKEHILQRMEGCIREDDKLRNFFEKMVKKAQEEGIINRQLPYYIMANAVITQAIGYSAYIGNYFSIERMTGEQMKEISYRSIVATLQVTEECC